MTRHLTALALSAALFTTPIATGAAAAAPAQPPSGYQVALFGHHTKATPKKHHRLRNAALAVGGALAVHHMLRKHRQHKAQKRALKQAQHH